MNESIPLRAHGAANRKGVSAKDLFALAEALLGEGWQVAFTVTGESMRPFLTGGRDAAILAACAPEELRVGDVALLRAPCGKYLLHRVTRIEKDGFETTGDACLMRDGLFPFSCLKARVCRVRNGKRERSCAAPLNRAAARVWMYLFPVRGPLLCAGRAAARGLRVCRNWFNMGKYVH